MFLDEVELTVVSGRGGAGSPSLRREKFVPRGGPDGGDGGRGGDVLLAADPGTASLQAFSRQRPHRAQDGANGEAARRHGADGASLRLAVPVGTVVLDAGSGRLIADLDRPGEEVVLARGGAGGRGNVHFATPTHQAPRRHEPGGERVERRVRLELRLIADLGLVGLPNAGKSTLLGRLTGARPKVGAYPFTTLSPNLGVAELEGGRTVTVADLPGLIEGAHLGAGLGLGFLRHATRTRALIQVIDLSEGPEAALAAFAQVDAELRAYDHDLARRPRLLALNKADLVADPQQEARRVGELLPPRWRKATCLISAESGSGCAELLAAAAARLGAAPASRGGGTFRLYEGPAGVSRQFAVSREGGAFRVRGEAVEGLVRGGALDDDHDLVRVQRRLRRLGVEAALSGAGAGSGDEVLIGETSFTFFPEGEQGEGNDGG
ncbi:MAG: GTPase ObgE [Candidatus Dormibacteria bacterium]